MEGQQALGRGQGLSPRQMRRTMALGGLSLCAAGSGQVDWRWVLVFLPVVSAAGGWLVSRLKDSGLEGRQNGRAVCVLYGAGAVLLLGRVLERAVNRLTRTGGSEEHWGWMLLLLAAFLCWLCWGKQAVFFRMAEVLWLAGGAVMAVLTAALLPHVQWAYLMSSRAGWWTSLMWLLEVSAAGLYLVPHLGGVVPSPEGRGNSGWLCPGLLGLLFAVVSALTVGCLGWALASRLPGAIFFATGSIYTTSRLEGLVSALWLIPDLTLGALLARSWGTGWRAMLAVLLAAAAAWWGIAGRVGPAVVALLVVCLTGFTSVLPQKAQK